MTVQEIVLDLLSYAGVYGFGLSGVPEDESEIVRAVAGVNAAIQTIYSDGPIALKYDTRSGFLNPPTTVTLTLTASSKTATTGTLPAWMRGCSVQIDGDPVLNRIQDITGPDGSNVVTLLRPYLGATGSHSAVVYGDCLLLEADVAAVLEPVFLEPTTTASGIVRLFPARSKQDFFFTYYWSNTDRYGRPRWTAYCVSSFYTTWEKTFGTPQKYRVEQRKDSITPNSLYLGVNPIPTAQRTITFDVYRRPVQVTRDDLAEDGGDDPDVAIACLAEDQIERLLLPIARWKYASAHPAIKNREVKATLKGDYDEAMVSLRNGMSLVPQINATRARYI